MNESDAADLDPMVEARVRAALRASSGMPEDVWTRLSAALAAEAQQANGQAVVVPLRRRTSLVPGLVAAAVVLVLAGIVLPGTLRPAQPEPVAAPAVANAVSRQAGPEADAANPEAGAVAAMAMPESLAQAPTATVLPAMQVTASGAEYTPRTLDDQVVRLLDTVGASNARLVANVQPDSTPTEGSTGFTATLEGLRDCLSALTTAPQALVIDRARFTGDDAAVVVLPPTDPASPFEVFVVGAQCSQADPAILVHAWIAPDAGSAE